MARQDIQLSENAVKNTKSRSLGIELEAKILQTKVKRGRLLDIGCDLGDLFTWFLKPDWECFGAEISPSAAAFASRTHDVKVYPGTVINAAFKENFFDLVTVLDTFYYVDNPQKELTEIYRILKPNGICAIEIPGQKYQMLRSRGLFCWLIDRKWTRLHTDSSYLYWFSSRGLEELFKNTGFSIDQILPIPSPSVSRNKIYKLASKLYYYQFNNMGQSFDWAPKYLMIGKKP